MCFLSVYWSLLSMVDQTLISLSSPQEASKRPSQEKLMPLILALWALINVVSFPEPSYPMSQNFNDSSLEAETMILPAGENFISWIWLYVSTILLYARLASKVQTFSQDSIEIWCYPCRRRQHTCKKGTNQERLLIIYALSKSGSSLVLLRSFAHSNFCQLLKVIKV